MNASSPAGVRLRIELGSTGLNAAEAAKLAPGSVAVLDQGIEELVKVYAGERLIGHGEMLNLDGIVCVRVVKLAERTSVGAAA